MEPFQKFIGLLLRSSNYAIHALPIHRTGS